MSQNQNQDKGKYYGFVKPTRSVPAPTKFIRLGTMQSRQLPSFSSLFESGPVTAPTIVMPNVPSQTIARASEAPAPSQELIPLNQTDLRNSVPPDHQISSFTGGHIQHDQTASHLGRSSPQDSLNPQCSPSAGPQPVGSTMTVPSNATNANTYHVATMEEDRLVVNIEMVRNQSTDNGLVPWEPRRPSNDDSPSSPLKSLLKSNNLLGRAHEPSEETVLGKRARHFSQGGDMKKRKKKYSAGSNLADSLDALALEHARATMSSSTISIPSSVSTRNEVHGNGDINGRSCQPSRKKEFRVTQLKSSDTSEPKVLVQRSNFNCLLQSNTVEPGNELDFLASVILSHNNLQTPTGESKQPPSAFREGSSIPQQIPSSAAPPQEVQDQAPQAQDLGAAEPRSEASFTSEDEPIIPHLLQSREQRSSKTPAHVITDESVANMENHLPNQAQVSPSPPQSNEIRRSTEASAPRIPAMVQLPTSVGDVAGVIGKGGSGYKLKRGPKSKKQKLGRVIVSTEDAGEKPKESNQKCESSEGPSSEVQRGSSIIKKKGSSTNRQDIASEKQEKEQPNKISSLSSRSVCSGPSSKTSATSRERTLLDDIPSNPTAAMKNGSQSKDTTRDGKASSGQENSIAPQDKHQRDEGLSWEHKSLRCTAKSAHAVRKGFQPESSRKSSGVDQRTKVVKNLIEQLEKEASSSESTPKAGSEVAGPPPIPLESIIAAAKQQPPPYIHKCEQCGSVFNRRFNLNKHIRNVHENIRKFACTTCGEFFLQKSHLAAHILAVHDKSRPFQCELCPKSFSWIGVLRKHMQSIHNIILQRKVIRKNRSPVLKGMNGGLETIDPMCLNVRNASRRSAPQNVITSPTTSVVVTPKTPIPIDVQPTS